MEELNAVAHWLSDAGIPFSHTDNRIEIPAYDLNGFSVIVDVSPDDCVVWCDGWHEHEFERDHLIDFLKLALSSQSRLMVLSRNNHEFAFCFELRQDNDWRPFSTVRYLNLAFWKRRVLTTRQNHWV